jgi:biopolymer transport protein ExbB/TolQ
MPVPACLRLLLLAAALLLLPSVGSAGNAAASPPATTPPPVTAPADNTPADGTTPAPATTPGLLDQAATGKPSKSVLVDLFKQGGPTMYFISLCLLLMLVIMVERAINVRRGNFAPAGLAEAASRRWQAGDIAGAGALGRQDGSILGDVIAFCADHHQDDLETIDQAAGDLANRGVQRHQSRVYWLSIVATLSPLLGLLGTVLGMISSFRAVSLTGDLGNMSQVAGGIAEALITTAYGLIVAVPALAIYHFFKIRISNLTLGVEDACSDFIVTHFRAKEG